MDKDAELEIELPAALLARQQLDSGVSAERLRHEQEQAHYNELYLLAPVGYFVVGFVKIDPSFAASLDTDGSELALYEAMVAMAHKLGLKVVAEGVETAAQRAALREAGCDYAQGYMFGHPMIARELEALALRMQ